MSNNLTSDVYSHIVLAIPICMTLPILFSKGMRSHIVEQAEKEVRLKKDKKNW
jgi:hypothetical protein